MYKTPDRSEWFKENLNPGYVFRDVQRDGEFAYTVFLSRGGFSRGKILVNLAMNRAYSPNNKKLEFETFFSNYFTGRTPIRWVREHLVWGAFSSLSCRHDDHLIVFCKAMGEPCSTFIYLDTNEIFTVSHTADRTYPETLPFLEVFSKHHDEEWYNQED